MNAIKLVSQAWTLTRLGISVEELSVIVNEEQLRYYRSDEFSVNMFEEDQVLDLEASWTEDEDDLDQDEDDDEDDDDEGLDMDGDRPLR
ncbi:MAG: hypothetical protein PF961_05855 [Planctomycetota bacterium]|jgi:hypothetical protein|nr:hypothetical protein [Planctomycetota bacterium]